MYSFLEDPFQTDLRLKGYHGKYLVYKAIKNFSARLKRLGIKYRSIQNLPINQVFPTTPSKTKIFKQL